MNIADTINTEIKTVLDADMFIRSCDSFTIIYNQEGMKREDCFDSEMNGQPSDLKYKALYGVNCGEFAFRGSGEGATLPMAVEAARSKLKGEIQRERESIGRQLAKLNSKIVDLDDKFVS